LFGRYVSCMSITLVVTRLSQFVRLISDRILVKIYLRGSLRQFDLLLGTRRLSPRAVRRRTATRPGTDRSSSLHSMPEMGTIL
jgi:hypothetical protein